LLLGAGLSQHIVDRWRPQCGVYRLANRPKSTEIDLAADEFLSDNPHRGGYHGMNVPGALKNLALQVFFFLNYACIMYCLYLYS